MSTGGWHGDKGQGGPQRPVDRAQESPEAPPGEDGGGGSLCGRKATLDLAPQPCHSPEDELHVKQASYTPHRDDKQEAEEQSNTQQTDSAQTRATLGPPSPNKLENSKKNREDT